MPLYIALPSRWVSPTVNNYGARSLTSQLYQFDSKRGLATGIAVAGSGFGGGVHSLYMRPLQVHIIIEYLLITYFSVPQAQRFGI